TMARFVPGGTNVHIPDRLTAIVIHLKSPKKTLPYAVWQCGAGKNYPSDAVYVGCRVLRSGKLIRGGHIFGNGSNPLVSHKGAIHDENEFRAYAVAKLQTDPAFREEAERLRGKDLLCWCVQSGPKRAKFCHARVWLELINQAEPWIVNSGTFSRAVFNSL